MKLLSIRDPNVVAICGQMGFVVPLRTAIAQIVKDARSAFDLETIEQTGRSRKELASCVHCLHQQVPAEVDVVDTDKMIGNASKSPDFVVAIGNGSSITLHCVDGKLGELFDYPGDRRGSSVRPKDLVLKHQGAAGALGNPAFLSNIFTIIVPKLGRQAMWHHVRSWARQRNASSVKFISLCVAEFLWLFAGSAELCNDGAMVKEDRARLKLILREFNSSAPLRLVMLPSQDDCHGCGTCERKCSHKAIRMVAASSGKMFPEIDQRLCTACRYCEKVCPALHV